MVDNHKVIIFHLLTLMTAKGCSYNKHFMVTADDNKVCKHYFYRAACNADAV